MHKLTAAVHRNIFAVGFLGGKSAQVTYENATLDLHIERKEGETNEHGSDRNQQSDKNGPFPYVEKINAKTGSVGVCNVYAGPDRNSKFHSRRVLSRSLFPLSFRGDARHFFRKCSSASFKIMLPTDRGEHMSRSAN